MSVQYAPPEVIVVGSLSMDIVLGVPRLPQRGETIKGTNFATFPGGKGNNQALAAARAGANTAMIGKVGRDAYGDVLLDTLKRNNVDIRGMLQAEDQTTGIANIWVGASGENTIVIVPNANGALTESEVEAAYEKFDLHGKVLLLQLEVELATTLAAARAARQKGARVILNPAPAVTLPAELLQYVDIIVPNETEAELLCKIAPDTTDNALACAEKLIAKGPGTVILTLGERGALVYERDNKPFFVKALKVNVIDSTAAGDAFCGAFAMSLAQGDNLEKAARIGCIAGSLACTMAGAVPSLPSRAEILKQMQMSA